MERIIIPTWNYPKGWRPQHLLDTPRSGPIPPTLRKTGIARVLNRTIIDACAYMGSYGGAGPGFWGVCLRKSKDFSREWLVLRIWAANEWLHFDDMTMRRDDRMSANKWDAATRKYIGAKIIKIKMADKSCNFTLRFLDGSLHHLEIKKNPQERPVYPGTKELRDLGNNSIWGAWVISKSVWLIV